MNPWLIITQTLYKGPVPSVWGSIAILADIAVVFGTSSKGKATVIYRNFEYIKERDNLCGTTSWHCQKYQSMQCKARLITSGNRIVSGRQPEHTHSGNVATAIARKAVGEMKTKVNDMNATSSSSQASVAATLDNDVLVALPKRKTVARTLQRAHLDPLHSDWSFSRLCQSD